MGSTVPTASWARLVSHADLRASYKSGKTMYRDKISVYDEHPLAGQDIQYRASDGWSRYTTPFDDILK